MSFLVRLLILFLVSSAAVWAEGKPSPAPSPAPSATPSPGASATPQPSPLVATSPAAVSAPSPASSVPPEGDAAALALPTPTPTADVSAPAASPEPSASPGGDTIPVEGQMPANGGAPLDTQNLAPAPPSSNDMPTANFTDPNAIVPDQAPAAPKATVDVKEVLRLENIRYHNVRIQADKDPQVLRMSQRADQAKTMEDERAAQREYYHLLFTKIAALDPTLAEKCKHLEDAYVRRLAQSRLEPTIPLNPPPTPEPLGR